MSAYSFMEIGGHLLLACRESYVPDLAALFTEDELRHDDEHFGYVSTVREVRDRLQLHGFTADRARAELDKAVQAWHAKHPALDADDLGVPVRDAAMILSELGDFVNSTDEWATYQLPEDVEWKLGARIILRLALDVSTDPGRTLRYNLDDLRRYRLLTPGTPITKQAREERLREIATDAPLVILTEGSSDSQLLSEAIQVTHPHLVGFLRFMDFGSGAQGSAGSLPKMVRSFVGAGVANRVLVLADNDTAARDALDKLKREGLPDGYRLMHYPDLSLLRRYPTLGPQLDDPVLMDVNGKAGSLEMYLGRELLTVNGELVPVQWTGYVEGRKSYQGAISEAEKNRIQRAFRKKVKAALLDPSVREQQDWGGVEAIVRAILGVFE
ncbi:HEPN/Toprim-associated domain-containing protein [Micromonospora chalcea]